MPRVRLLLLALAACVVSSVPAAAQAAPRRVLILYSYEREFSHLNFARRFRPELTESSREPIDFTEATLQTVRASGRESDAAILDGLRGTFGPRRIDLVVTLGGPAASFAQKYRDELFPHAPVLLTAVDSRFVRTPLPPNETAVMVHHDPALVVDGILTLLPDTTQVVVIIGASAAEAYWLREVQHELGRFGTRVQFIWTNQLSFEQLVERCRTLPPHSAIFYAILSMDAKGMPQIEDQALASLHAAADAPMFGLHSHQLGLGIVGGQLLSLDDLSHDATRVALQLLRGVPATAIPPRTLFAGAPSFDARELRRWGIPEARLRPDSVIRFREPPVWRRHQMAVAVAAVVVAAQALLVIGLAVNLSRRRRSTEADVKNAEAALARLTHRLLHARETERAAIAATLHDDICQQMTGLKLRLASIGLAGDADAASPRRRIEDLCDKFSSLERQVLALSDPVYARLQLLGLVAAARALCQRVCMAAGIRLQFAARDVPFRLPEMVTVALFRVVQHAMENAVSHASTPVISVSMVGSSGAIELEIADEGVGFDPDEAMRTEAVGLVEMRERMRAVGGTCVFASRRGNGARVLARVPV
jgi:signal transduction histidine kinase